MELSYLPDILLKLIAAIVLGGSLGIERTIVGKYAGLRTYALVSMGSALFVAMSQIVGSGYGTAFNFDPMRVASQVVVGIGFLGAGLIFFQENKLQGLTTAAGLWVAAGLGMACGFGLYLVALVGALLTLIVLHLLFPLEEKIRLATNHEEAVVDGVKTE